MRALPLAAEHERLGATTAAVANWLLPAHYGDPVDEQLAVHRDAGLVDWSAKGKVRVTGEDRLSFLDGLLTNDLKALAPGDGLYAATLDHKGRVRGDMIVHAAADRYLLETEVEAGDRVLAYLRSHLVSDDVTLEEVTDTYGLLGLFGPRSRAIAADILGVAPPTVPYAQVDGSWRGHPFALARSPAFGGEGYAVWLPAADSASMFRALLDAGAHPFGHEAAEALRIEAGRPKFPVDMNEDTLALEARLEPAISMTKGCYVGQEIVSRATHIGQVHRLLVGLSLDGAPPAPGAGLLAGGARVGAIASAAHSATLGTTIALGYVRRETAEPGTRLAVMGNPTAQATVAALPFLSA